MTLLGCSLSAIDNEYSRQVLLSHEPTTNACVQHLTERTIHKSNSISRDQSSQSQWQLWLLIAYKGLNVSLSHYRSPRKSLNSIQVVNDSKDTNGVVSGHSMKAEDDDNDHDDSEDDKGDDGGPGDAATSGC